MRGTRPSLLAQHQIHDPAPADVGGVWVAAVVEDGRVVAPGVLQRVRQYRHRAEVAGLGRIPLRLPRVTTRADP